MNVHEDWKEHLSPYLYILYKNIAPSNLIYFTVVSIVSMVFMVYHGVFLFITVYAQIQIVEWDMHFIFARLVENVFELNLELTLSKADYQNHLNELYVYGYYRTVAPDVTVFHHLLILKFFYCAMEYIRVFDVWNAFEDIFLCHLIFNRAKIGSKSELFWIYIQLLQN